MSGPDKTSGEESHTAGSEETHGAQAPQGPVPPPAEPDPDENLPARLGEERLAEPVVRTGMFGLQDTPDTSGFGLLRVHRAPVLASPRPYGSYFDDVADALGVFGFVEMVLFILTVFVAYAYVWRRGGLEWD